MTSWCGSNDVITSGRVELGLRREFGARGLRTKRVGGQENRGVWPSLSIALQLTSQYSTDFSPKDLGPVIGTCRLWWVSMRRRTWTFQLTGAQRLSRATSPSLMTLEVIRDTNIPRVPPQTRLRALLVSPRRPTSAPPALPHLTHRFRSPHSGLSRTGLTVRVLSCRDNPPGTPWLD